MPYKQLREDYEELLALLKEHRRRNRKFTVAFCGIFSSGKSSLINALLESKYKIPTGINPITKNVTRIQYGWRFHCRYVSTGKTFKLSQSDADLMICGDKPLPDGCSEIIYTLPSRILRRKVVFIDTPGFQDECGERLEAISRKAVSKADLVVFCSNATQFGNDFERDYIDELAESIGNFCIAINRMDNLNTKEDIRQVEAKARWLMEKKGVAEGSGQGRFFLTVSSGRQIQVQDIKDYLRRIFAHMRRRKRIRKTTADKMQQYCARNLLREVQAEGDTLLEQCTMLETRNEQQLMSLKNDYLDRLSARKLMLEKVKSDGRLMLDSTVKEIETELKAFGVSDFVKEANEAAHKNTEQLIGNLLDFAKESHIPDREKFEEEIRDCYHEIPVSVPAPVSRQIVVRTGFQRLGRTIRNFMDSDLTIDSGKETVYNEYQRIAVSYINKKVLRKLMRKWEEYLDHNLDNFDSEPMEGGLEVNIDAMKILQEKVQQLNVAVSALITKE